jgi:N,N'-diacetylchitobiose transport system substrate-binding protein
MRVRVVAAVTVCASLAFGVAAAGAVLPARAASPHAAAATTLRVWLQVDAQQNWEGAVNAARNKFEASHPGVDVKVEYQTWNDHLTKFDAALAGNNAPDVIEMGNTEMTKYMAAGAFQDLTSDKASFPNSSSWLEGLAASGRFGGKLYGVPYYAGSRVVTYRTDLFKQAGVNKLPTSIAEFTAAAKKVAAKNTEKTFSPVYIAGTDWYVAMSFVYDHGGKIAITNKGKWIGTLDRPKAVAGLTAFKKFYDASSRASKTTDETRPNPYDVYAQGNAASMIGPGWFSCCVGTHKANTAQFVMPSRTQGQPIPGFLGGSDLAVPVGADKAQAASWIRAFTDNASMTALRAKGNIPNTTSLLGTSVNERAARRSWFVPTAKHWVNVENGNILRTMLARILTNKMTVKQAAEVASDNIAFTLNQK